MKKLTKNDTDFITDEMQKNAQAIVRSARIMARDIEYLRGAVDPNYMSNLERRRKQALLERIKEE